MLDNSSITCLLIPVDVAVISQSSSFIHTTSHINKACRRLLLTPFVMKDSIAPLSGREREQFFLSLGIRGLVRIVWTKRLPLWKSPLFRFQAEFQHFLNYIQGTLTNVMKIRDDVSIFNYILYALKKFKGSELILYVESVFTYDRWSRWCVVK